MIQLTAQQTVTSFLRHSLLVLLGTAPLLGQGAQYLAVSPKLANLSIGESQRFRVVDQSGNMQHNVSWAISDPGAFTVEQGDELVVTAKSAGTFHVLAKVSAGSLQAEIKVIAGNAFAEGTVKWSAATPKGCKITQTAPAPPNDNGIAVYESSTCPDGTYVSAYTPDGVQVWRRKVSDAKQPAAQGASRATPGPTSYAGPTSTRLGSLASVCDQIAIGNTQEQVRDLLKSHHLSFSNEGANGQVWVVEEATSRCKLWFDDKPAVTKKSKTLVSE
jgi:hypothetical protein